MNSLAKPLSAFDQLQLSILRWRIAVQETTGPGYPQSIRLSDAQWQTLDYPTMIFGMCVIRKDDSNDKIKTSLSTE